VCNRDADIISPESLEISQRPDGNFWVLGKGTFGQVFPYSTLMGCHCSKAIVFPCRVCGAVRVERGEGSGEIEGGG
jgi:hypothetical protein